MRSNLSNSLSLVSSLNSGKARTFKGGSVLVFLDQNIKFLEKDVKHFLSQFGIDSNCFSLNFVSHKL